MLYPVMISHAGVENIELTMVDLLGCSSQAPSIEQGIEQLKKEVTNHLELLVEYGEQIPQPSAIEKQLTKLPENFISFYLMEIDLVPYLGKSHKINVTLPELLIAKIDQKVNSCADYKTRSHFIAQACLSELRK